MNELYAIYAVVFLFSLVMGFLIMPRIVSISYRKRLMDVPDERRVHQTPVPRLGGISFLPLTLMSVFLFDGLCVLILDAHVQATDTPTFLRMQFCGMGAMLLYLIGEADDLVGVDYKAKFGAQLVAACMFPLSGLWLGNLGGLFGIYQIPEWIGIPLTLFLVVYITNGINLIDGVDGLASGICILAFMLYASMFIFLSHPVFAAICLSILGVLTTFFIFNVFGGRGNVGLRKLFMGDTGSLTLGYVISFLVIHVSTFSVHRVFVSCGAFYVALSPLIIPLLDIIRVVYARYRDRVPLFAPDKRHIHHKLLRTGLSPRGVMIVLLFLTVYFIGLNALLSQYTSATWVLAADLISWVFMHLVINRYIHRMARLCPEVEQRYENRKNTIPENNKFTL